MFERLEGRRLLAGMIEQVGYFDVWDSGVIPSTDPAGITFHAPSGSLYIADSEINEIPQFQGDNIFRSSLDGQQLLQAIASNNKEPTGITYNESDGFFYVTNDDTHTIQRYDSNLNNPLATVFTEVDVPNASDPEGITSDPATGYLYVVDGHGGGTQVLAYDPNLVFQYSFPVSGLLSDAEGIAFNPDSNHLFVVSSADNLIVEYALNGAYVEQYDINHLTPDPGSPQGLTFGPTSDPFDDPNDLALYIADGGRDNFPDGGIYEILVSGGQLAQNTAPLVNAGGNQDFLATFPTNVDLNAAVADDDLPGPPGSLTTFWSQVSGPAAMSFADPTAIDPTVTFSAAGTYVLRLTADDGELITSDNTIIVVGQGVEVRVTASSDDAEERTASGKMILTSIDLDLGEDAGGITIFDQIVGLRFSELNIPQGAVIQNAYIQFQADETTSVAASLTIEGEDSDDAPTFTTTTSNISTRSRTTSFASWSPAPWTKGDAGPDQRTPNIAAVIQEIVNRTGWSSGHDMAIIISGTGERVAETYDGLHPPLLHVEFTLPGDPPDNPFPWHNALLAQDVNADGTVSPLDALVIINDLNSNGSRPLSVGSGAPYLDVSRDGVVSPIDVLQTVNFLNGSPVSGGEGEASVQIAPLSVATASSSDPALIRDVAAARAMARDDLRRTSLYTGQVPQDFPHRSPVNSAANLRPASSDIARQDDSTIAAGLEETLDAFVEDIAKFWNRS